MTEKRMTGRERCDAVLKAEAPDRIPFFPLLMFFAADRAGVPYREYATNHEALVSAQLNMFVNYKVDAVTVCSDAFRLSADLGGDMVFPENQTPYCASPIVKNESDLAALKRPDPGRKGSRMRDRVDAVEKISRAVGDRAMVF